MHTLSLFEAKTHLSRIVQSLVDGSEDEVIISRHGKPVARVSPLRKIEVSKRIGLAKGRFKVPDDIDASNAVVARLFSGKGNRNETPS